MRKKETLFVFLMLILYLALSFVWQDLHLYDDSYYLDSGLHLHLSSFLNELNSAPLYALWFRLLQVFVADPVSRYFVSWGLLVAIVVLLPLCLGMRGTWLYAFALVALPVFVIAPYVSLFAAIFVLAGMVWLLRHETADLPGACWVACLSCFGAALSRPEYAYGVLVCALAFGAAFTWSLFDSSARRVAEPRSNHFVQAVFVLVLAATIALMLHRSDASRSGIAFAQHFNVRAAQKGLIPAGENPWTSDYAMRAFHLDLGRNAANTRTTTGAFARANPRLFLGHIFSNLVDPRTVVFGGLILALAAWPWIRPSASRLRSASVFLAVVSVPPMLAYLVIYPRNHYAVVVLPAALLYFGEVIGVREWQLRPRHLWLVPVAALLILSAGLGIKQTLKFHLHHARPGIASVRCVQQFERETGQPNAEIFDSAGIPNVYLKTPRARIDIYDVSSWKEFTSWVETSHGWVLLAPNTAQYLSVSPDVLSAELAKAGEISHACPANPELTLYAPAAP